MITMVTHLSCVTGLGPNACAIECMLHAGLGLHLLDEILNTSSEYRTMFPSFILSTGNIRCS